MQQNVRKVFCQDPSLGLFTYSQSSAIPIWETEWDILLQCSQTCKSAKISSVSVSESILKKKSPRNLITSNSGQSTMYYNPQLSRISKRTDSPLQRIKADFWHHHPTVSASTTACWIAQPQACSDLQNAIPLSASSYFQYLSFLLYLTLNNPIPLDRPQT